MRFYLIIILSLALVLSGCGSKQKESKTIDTDRNISEIPFYNEVAPAEAKNIIDNNSNLIIIDVSSDYKSGHLPRAINVPIAEIESKIIELNKNRTYLIYARQSAYSIAVASRLAENGFENVYHLDGDFLAWQSAGYKIEK